MTKERPTFSEMAKAHGLDPTRDMRFANWSGCDFSGADLTGFDFTGARLMGCDFTGAKIAEARFDQAEVLREQLWKTADWEAHVAAWCPQDAPPDLAHLADFAVFSDAPFAPEMVMLPAGEFLMGSPEDEAERLEREGPQQRIRFAKRFALGRYASTFEEYDFFCSATKRRRPDDRWGRGRMPATDIDCKDACAYCEWINQKTGGDYGLPSEAQWEYGCRADSQTPFCESVGIRHGGLSITPEEVNYRGSFPYRLGKHGRVRDQTVVVDHSGFRPNAWGLWQMHGNVWEWCADALYDSHEGALPDGSARLSSKLDGGTYRIIRGGSWYGGAWYCRAAYRDGFGSVGRDDIGFRLSRGQVS